VACANLGGLVVVRAVSRRGEIALRLALGASRARIVRLLIVENLVLAIPGAILGVILAARALPVLLGYAQAMAAPNRLFFNMETDALVIGFAALVACGSAMLFGFAPALRSAKIDLVAVMKEESPRGAHRSGFRSALVVAQVAVSLVLLFGSGLVTRTLDAAKQAERGYRASGTTAVTVDVKANGYDESRGREFYRRLLETAKAQPGVESAALAAETPLTFLERKRQPILVEGYDAKPGEDLSMLFNVVSPGYFTTLGIPVAAGREFDARDEATAESVALVNRTMAEKYWGSSTSALGKRVRTGDGAWRTVVGVVGDIKYVRVNEAPRPYVYLPFSQAYRSTMVLHTHGAAPIETLVTEARRAVAAVDDQLPVVAARSLEQATGGALIFYNFMSSMLFIFGVAGMGLAAMGTYGLVAYTVKQSTHEIGIRMALGASAARVVRTFVQRGARLGLIGIAIGTAAALGLGTVLRSVLFGVSPTDGVSFAQALAIVTGVVLAATLVPAWRASRTDPLKALRHQ
jgi:predicted permease